MRPCLFIRKCLEMGGDKFAYSHWRINHLDMNLNPYLKKQYINQCFAQREWNTL